VWSKGYFAAFHEDISRTISNQGDFEVLYAGADVLLLPNVMLNVGSVRLAQRGGTVRKRRGGQGWMAGPYLGILFGRNW
jgi:hypothetical protein